ncbi:GNAT family N-acetyltransferase [Clostridiaceae bacterium 35-E11]
MIDMPICEEPEGEYTYKELTKNEIEIKVDCLLELWRNLVQYLRMSPTYYPEDEFTDRAFLDHIHNKGTRLFVVEQNQKIIGMIDVSKDSNSFITTEEDTMNVGELYIKQNYRGYNIVAGLLLHVNNTLKKEGVKRLWVEHGTTNPTAQRFWGKYFNQFTYTLTRKIDERIII